MLVVGWKNTFQTVKNSIQRDFLIMKEKSKITLIFRSVLDPETVLAKIFPL